MQNPEFVNSIGTEESDLDSMLVKLERNHKCVLRISTKLQSYTYEPTNMECFEKLRNLRTGFRDLAREQVLFFEVLKTGKHATEVVTEKVKGMLDRFSELEKNMAAYLLETKGYY